MNRPQWRIRVTFYLPSGLIEGTRIFRNDRTAYLAVRELLQENFPEVTGYSDTEIEGYWRSPAGEDFRSEIHVVAIDYKQRNKRLLNAHIEATKMMIYQVYVDNGRPQELVYVLSQDIAQH